MKTLHSVNRRSFNIEPAGYFNVLRPSTRFIPQRVSSDFRDLVGQSKGTAYPQTHENPATALQFALIPIADRNAPLYLRLLRPALIVLAAIGLTFFLIWCSGGCPIHITF